MRILIQDPLTSAYYNGANWENAIEDAMDFESTSEAERYCLEKNLPGAYIVVKFNDPSGDIQFPAGARHSLLTAKATVL